MELQNYGLQRIYVDLAHGVYGKIEAKEGEVNSRGLLITLTKNGKEISPSEEVQVMFYAKTQDGLVYERELERIADGNYSLIYPANILKPGYIEAELRMYKDDSVLASTTFIIEVNSAIVGDEILEGLDEPNLITKILQISRNEDERIALYEEIKTAYENGDFKGEQGLPGRDGVDGKDGADGAPGRDGVDGKDGVDGAPGRDGVDGKDGVDGAPGKDGREGPEGPQGPPGSDATVTYQAIIDALGFVPADDAVIGDILTVLQSIRLEEI